MTPRVSMLLPLLLVASCARCSSPAAEPDAAPVWYQPLSTATHERHSTDLRSVLLVIFPEYRQVKVKGGHAILTRKGQAQGSVVDLVHQTLKANGFSDGIDDGKLSGSRGNLMLRLVSEGPPAVMDIGMPVNAQMIENVYGAPTSLGTMEMALYFPRDPKVFETELESFEFQLNYEGSTEERSRFLVHQVVSMLLKNDQWKSETPLPPDFNDGGVPEFASFMLRNVADDARVEFRRSGIQVSATYRLITARKR